MNILSRSFIKLMRIDADEAADGEIRGIICFIFMPVTQTQRAA